MKPNYSSNSNSNNKFNYTSTKPNVESKINKQKINPIFSQPPIRNNRRPQNFNVEEVDDDRPAFVEGGFKEPEIPDDATDLHECNGCGRKFREEALQKHAKACKKVFQSKRKAFDTKKKRIIDSEHAAILRQAEYEEKSNTNTKLQQIKNKKNNWKKKSEMLRNVAAVNKTGSEFMGKNSGKTVQITGKNTGGHSNDDDDLTFCKLCERRYNDEAYKRHLTHCERKEREGKMKGKLANNKPTTINSKPNYQKAKK